MDTYRRNSTTPPNASLSSGNGVCLMRSSWKEDQRSSFIDFISTFLSANSFRLNFVPIVPDFIFNCGGLSVAFIFVTNWDCNNVAPIFNRIQQLKAQFSRFYVVITLPGKEEMDSFIESYFKFGMVIGKPTFIPVKDLEMGFEKMVKIAHSSGVIILQLIAVYKQEGIEENFKAERKKLVQGMNFYLKVVTSIPGIDNHDANALSQAIGSVQAIANASKEQILENTDLSTDKAEMVSREAVEMAADEVYVVGVGHESELADEPAASYVAAGYSSVHWVVHVFDVLGFLQN
ncbi:protein PARTING DANCERS-like [Vicia villosa]|uniref:protein PARTING DANCERS-like n=1 Tax=Vicia villosa TaxID=3911 RepID=UPI00273ADF1C|nr:protein PARTING DANCERS-like [Vicia villosa]